MSLLEKTPKIAIEVAKITGVGLLTYWLSNYAFSKSSQKEIKYRTNHKSEVSHTSNYAYKKDRRSRPCEAAHINHDKKNPHYDNPDLGMYLTDIEHWIFHKEFQEFPEAIGLSYEDNLFAIRALEERIYEFNREHNVSMPEKGRMDLLAEGVRYLVAEKCRRNGMPDPYNIMESMYAEEKSQEA